MIPSQKSFAMNSFQQILLCSFSHLELQFRNDGRCLPALKHGITVILAKKFSVHNCWDDCRRHNATILLYIGEFCRYLLTLPETPEDKNHSIRIAMGNGLRQDIWTKFRRRYSILTIAEFYGCTEGRFFTINSDNTPAVIGKFSPFVKAGTSANYEYATVIDQFHMSFSS
ncbi:long-chain fatty acid transport protein 5-like [Ptychodera flava]|uniref:long-chain fatty acid transport protein 5-like n=1 Tax=Ptychodera flava TaxID=63121 RepID=UPI00396A00DE